MVQSGPSFSNSGGVAQHANSSLDFGQISTWNDGWWLVVDTYFKSSWTPVNKLNCSFSFDGGDGAVDILWYDVTSVKQAARHVFTVSWIAFDHLVGWLKASVGDFGNGQLLVVSFFGGNDWSISGQWEMDSWVWDQVGLEFSQINVQSTIESKGSGDRRNDLSDQPVQVGVSWSFDVQVSSTNIVNGFVVDHEGAIGVFQGGMGGENGVVWLNNRGGDLRSWVNSELQLRFFTVVNRQSLHQQGSKSGSGTTTKRVKDQKSLKTGTLIGQFSSPIQNHVDELFTNGIVSSSVVVGGILFTGDQLFWVEQLSVGTGSDFIDNSWLQINEYGSWNVFASASFGEEGVERIITTANGFIGRHLSVWLDSVLEAVELPTGITHLDSGLANMD
jgi:hypothetical protein